MIGLVLATHGKLGEAMIQSMEIVIGEQPGVEALSLQVKDDIKEAREKLDDAMKKADDGQGVLIMTDMLGGTPSNLCLSFLNQPLVEVVSGVNLPMLLKAVQVREDVELREVASQVKEHGRSGIIVAREVLEGGSS